MQDKSGMIECVTPSFAAQSRIRIRPSRVASDGACRYCDRLVAEVIDDDGAMVYPILTQLHNIALVRNRLNFGGVATMALTAFAEGVRVWKDEDAFNNADDALLAAEPDITKAALSAAPDSPATQVRFAAESFIPSGMFGEATTEEAHAMMTGRVLRSEARTNHETGRSFTWALVKTYGATIDVVAASTDIPAALEPGNIVQGSFWCVGRITDGLREKPKGLLGVFRN